MNKNTLFTAASLALSAAVSSAASIEVDAVGVINTNGLPVLEATGNSTDATTFATTIATAFGNNSGGVWNGDGADFDVLSGETISINYGASLTEQLVLTLGGTAEGLDQSLNPTEATSGETTLGIRLVNGIRTFTPDIPLLTVAIFNTDRNDAGRIPTLQVTYLDTSTASTSGANADDTYFHALSGTAANPIVSFSLDQNNYVRYDDLAFVAVPEPASTALFGLGGLAFLLRRRR